MNPALHIDSEGYFARGEERILPVGVNYWPASCGVAMWERWPEAEIRKDLDLVKGLGLNCIRFFLRWPDFEPSFGVYSTILFDRLRQMMEWCAERNLLAHPSLVTGWMSGGTFWPVTKGRRNLYANPYVAAASVAYCKRAAETLAPFDAALLAIDLGNELGCVDCTHAPPAAVAAWCSAAAKAIRSAYPAARIVSGTDSGIVIRDSGWRLGEQPGVDFYSVHTYPVPTWNILPFDGMTDRMCQDILPYCTLAARAFGPVMVQEFSAILMNGTDEVNAYLDYVLPECLANGANGFLWWCLRDVTAQIHPYIKCPIEGQLGLLDAQDRLKPEVARMVEWMVSRVAECNRRQSKAVECNRVQSSATDIALYWPQEYYPRDNERNPGNAPENISRYNIVAYHFLRKLGHRPALQRGGMPIPPTVKTLIIAGAALTNTEAERLEQWVREGGTLLWSAPGWMAWGKAVDRIVGASPVSIRHPKPVTVTLFGREWTLRHHPSGERISAKPLTAKVLATSTEGTPEVLLNDCGKGRVVTVLPLAEETIAHTADDLPARDSWSAWYAGILNLLR